MRSGVFHPVMDSEELLGRLSGHKCNLFQWITFLKLGLVYLRGAWPVLGIIFLGANPGFECSLPDNTNDTKYYKDGECSIVIEQSGRNVTEKCTYGIRYGNSVESTILTEFNLVCDNDYLVDLSTTIYMIGSALGAVLMTPLSDKFGRKKVLLGSLWAQGVVGVGVVFVQSYVAFVILRFAVAFLNMAIALIAYVMVTELFTATKRTRPSVGINIFWSFGIVTLALFGYLVRNWRHLQLLISLPNFLTILFIWFLPESMHWLVTNGRWKSLQRTVEAAARANGVAVPQDVIEELQKRYQQEKRIQASSMGTGNSEHSFQMEVVAGKDRIETKVVKMEPKPVVILDLFRTPKIRKYTIVMFYLWFVISLAYFGILFSTPTLHGDMFLNLAISGAVEIPACLVCMRVLERTGRRKPLVCFLLLCGVMNIIPVFIPTETASGISLQPMIITLAMIGKFGITCAYSTVYLMSAEIFPTAVRNQAVGLSSFFENSGSISAPFIVYGAKNMAAMPLVIFGSLTVIGGLLALLLPETQDRALPETVPDINPGPLDRAPEALESGDRHTVSQETMSTAL
ncbi:hypothetical protein DPMN_088347 [Dreissena polymorpha]|uniref:Major facilitator superfamily (MFS) profile domain-containing protein n=2 Tax=Dreissena polymorpha TaxID=45954 RepID=A0A9D4KUP0_DREPO|nr:hypothetical protein DPMN_088347 [Dreissena polymorpha]